MLKHSLSCFPFSVSIFNWFIGGNETEEPPMALTPANFNIEITAPQGEYIPSTGTVSIHGDLKGGKPAYVFGLIVYVDQGFAYTVHTEYTYMKEV